MNVSWRLPKVELETFRRNPLAAVILQLQYDPILNIGAGVPAFQDVIRKRFSLYEERNVRDVEVDFGAGPTAGTNVKVRDGMQYRFSCRSESTSVMLDERSVTIEYLGSHKSRETLFSDVELVLRAFFGTYQNASLTRLGLRYVNSIRREAIANDLGLAGLPLWSQLLHRDFLRIPRELVDFRSAHSYHELTSELSPGHLTLRYGMPLSQQGEGDFRLDIDRFCMADLEISALRGMVEQFADDIFDVFMAAAGDQLIQWMREAI